MIIYKIFFKLFKVIKRIFCLERDNYFFSYEKNNENILINAQEMVASCVLPSFDNPRKSIIVFETYKTSSKLDLTPQTKFVEIVKDFKDSEF